MKNYPLVAHALHSRLQMIRNKIHVSKDMKPDDLIRFNERYFTLACQSVEKIHNCQCGRSEQYQAAEMFLFVYYNEDHTIKDQPLWTVHKNSFYKIETCGSGENKDKWHALSEKAITGKGTGDIMKMTYEEAQIHHRYLCKRSSSVNFRISKYNPLTDDPYFY